MNTLHRQRPWKFLFAGLTLCIAAFAAVGTDFAVAQDWPGYARPDWQHDQEYQREPGWQQDPRQQEPDYQDPGYQQRGYRDPGYQRQDQRYQQEPEWRRDPRYQRDPGYRPEPGWQRYQRYQQDPGYQQEPEWQRYPRYPQDPGYQRDPEWEARPGNPDPYRQREPSSYDGRNSPYWRIYAEPDNEPFPVPALRLSDVDPVFLRRSVYYPGDEAPGTIVIDPQRHFLYFIEGGGRAIRYGVGVGRTGYGWSGVATVHHKQAWPDWHPPREMLARQPEIQRLMTELPSGYGMPGGLGNPLGARALYLWQGSKDTLFRIHGTIEPWTIGHNVSSGCIRMINQDVIDLYARARVGAKVIVLPSHESVARQ